jgi:predicted metalloprotease with PDZ domain
MGLAQSVPEYEYNKFKRRDSMKSVGRVVAACWMALHLTLVGASPGPTAIARNSVIAPPVDRPYGGEIHLDVDATDIGRRVVHVHETLSGVRPDTVLLYPKWLPGTHAPEGPIDRLAGLKISAHEVSVAWNRDPTDVFAFRLHAPSGAQTIEIDFDYLSPTSPQVGALEISRDFMMLEWNELVLYPAGYFVRQIPVDASLTVPAGWPLASALETAATGGSRTTFKRVSLETLVDSPVFAGRYYKRLQLDADPQAPVSMDLFGDRPGLLELKPEQLAAHRALVQQAYKLFDSHHYDHYDFLYALSDQVQESGLEHHRSSEDTSDPETITEWDKTAYARDLLAHEFTHSWNGKFRRPADLWTPNYNVPMQSSLLWVYEGQTEYWGQVLAARSGLRTKQQALDQLALTAAVYEHQAGRRWRSLQDTTNDEIINPRRPQSWPDWQRFEDYYGESAFFWLDADTLIRERSGGKRSLDDFAKAFFGIHNSSFTPVTYTFDDVVAALNAVEQYDWATFLHKHLDSAGQPVPLEGLRRGGYKLTYTDTPSDYLRLTDEQRKHTSLLFSIGVKINEKGGDAAITQVLWDSAAFRAKITEGARILAINGIAYDADVLKDAIRAAHGTQAPIQLILKTGDRFSVVDLDYHDGLRYPRLERDTAEPGRLDEILTAK